MGALVGLMRTLIRGNPDVVGVMVVDADGRVHAGEAAQSSLLASATAVAVPLRELLDRTATELGCGELAATVVEGSHASFAMADVDGFRSVIVLGANGAAPGALRADAIWAADAVRRGAAA